MMRICIEDRIAKRLFLQPPRLGPALRVGRLRHAAALPGSRWGLLCMALLLVVSMAGNHASAAVIVTATETAGDVVFAGGGTLDLTALSKDGDTVAAGFIRPIGRSWALGATPGALSAIDVYGTGELSVPGAFGPGIFFVADSGSGDRFGVGQFITSGPQGLGVPAGYVSGSPLSGSMTFSGASFASLGLTPGVYTWSWGSGANADTLTLNIMEEAAVTTDDLLLFFDQVVADGDLYGMGSGSLARLRLHLMRLMLVVADELVEGDHIDLACAQLQVAHHFIDGQPLPRDLVTGPATPELALLITNVREMLGCE